MNMEAMIGNLYRERDERKATMTNDTPRCNALESNGLDSFDVRAWKTLARQLERELLARPDAVIEECARAARNAMIMSNGRAGGHVLDAIRDLKRSPPQEQRTDG